LSFNGGILGTPENAWVFGLQRLPRVFLGHLLSGQPAKFVIDQRQKLLGRMGIALANGREDAGDVGHGRGFQRQDQRS